MTRPTDIEQECAFCDHYEDEHTDIGCAVEECPCANFLSFPQLDDH